MSDDDPHYVAALLERVGRLLSQEAHASSLNPVQWEVLRYLAKANRFSNTAAALTAYLGQTKGTVSQSLMALQSKALIRKLPDKRDKRSTRLFLTARGKRQLAADPLISTVDALATLPGQNRQELGAGLRQLLTNRLSELGRQPFGQCRNCRYFGRDHPLGDPHRCLLIDEPLSDSDASRICVEQVAD